MALCIRHTGGWEIEEAEGGRGAGRCRRVSQCCTKNLVSLQQYPSWYLPSAAIKGSNSPSALKPAVKHFRYTLQHSIASAGRNSDVVHTVGRRGSCDHRRTSYHMIRGGSCDQRRSCDQEEDHVIRGGHVIRRRIM